MGFVGRLAAFVALAAVVGVQAKIPDYIPLCKRHDPKIEQCIIKSVEVLRPKLMKGIPELDIPPLEPLYIPEIVISRGGAFRAVGTDVTVKGASSFEITSLKADVKKLEYIAGLRIPSLIFDAIYDVNAKILSVNLKGKGPIQFNATNVEGTGILKGHMEKGDGVKVKRFVKFDTLELKLKLKNYSVRLENLFNGDKNLGEAVNAALNDNKKELMQIFRPRAEAKVSEVLLDIANKITTHFDYDELFPVN